MTFGNAFISYDFLYFMKMFALTGFFLALSPSLICSVLAGVLLSLAALVKHSDGTVLFLFSGLCLLTVTEKKLLRFLLFSGSSIFVVLMTFLPFLLTETLSTAFASLIVEASNNKGGGYKPLYQWFTYGFFSVQNLSFLIGKVSIPLLVIGFFALCEQRIRSSLPNGILTDSILFVVGFTSAVVLGLYLGEFKIESIQAQTTDFFQNTIYLACGYVGPLLIAVAFLRSRFGLEARVFWQVG